MQRKILRGTRLYQVEGQSLLVLKYYLIKKPTSSGDHYYGIEISQEKIAGNLGGDLKYNSLLLSTSKGWMEELIDKFIGNGVTPDTMTYIIDDIMGIPC